MNFRHLARHLPGEVAFSGSYLKCYDGVVGETWRAFCEVIEIVGRASTAAADQMVLGARDAFRCEQAWQDEACYPCGTRWPATTGDPERVAGETSMDVHARTQRVGRPGQLVLRPDLDVTGIQVFSATMPAQRANLGEVVTAWIAAHSNTTIVDITVTQSSDSDFHCLSITIAYCRST